MKFTQLHLFLKLLGRDTFGLCDTEFYTLKVFFSVAGNDINIETDDKNDDVYLHKTRMQCTHRRRS